MDDETRHVQRLGFERAIRLEGVCYAYPGSDADVITGIHLEIPRNSSVALAGKSGAGKTTLADLIAGLLEPREGAVKIDGRVLNHETIAGWQMARAYILPREISSGLTNTRLPGSGIAERKMSMAFESHLPG